ncbi:unnamed protein product [Psylliodes chrysocephalus]|uniref:Zinc finger MYM-type protein 1-like n=1 Tax=Psylliodes chrysocephalus TaxID=3402493 RepID=A0A9P0CNK4_9CUCU|nr:unnamed protein product [Psylliodes chrysocephala]
MDVKREFFDPHVDEIKQEIEYEESKIEQHSDLLIKIDNDSVSECVFLQNVHTNTEESNVREIKDTYLYMGVSDISEGELVSLTTHCDLPTLKDEDNNQSSHLDQPYSPEMPPLTLLKNNTIHLSKKRKLGHPGPVSNSYFYNMMNSVQYILKTNFSRLSLAEKCHIKSSGRPTPDLELTQTDKSSKSSFTRRFSRQVYNKNKWICGCDTLNALFCFPCLLFYSDGTDNVWSRVGFKDLKHLNEKIKKHELSAKHINFSTELAFLGTANIAAQLNSTYRQNIIKHNEQVDKNRYVLKRIINCIKFCGKLELVLRGYDENDGSENRGVFGELIDFTSELDSILKEHLKNATVFKGTSKTIQNEILDSMLEVCRNEIREQINKADFLSVQCDETSDISNHCQMVMVFRYLHEGSIVERFWCFLKILDKTATGLTNCIKTELESLLKNTPDKLIAQAYDGANVMSNKTGGVQSKIKETYKNAHFVHCYAHQLNLIMQKATSQNTKVKIFFATLSEIPSFFSTSTHKCDILEEIVRIKMPKVTPTCWNYNIRTVNSVFENREKLIECFRELEEKCEKTITCKEASGLKTSLEDPNFVFWLTLFHKILPHVDTLFNQFQSGNNDSVQLLIDIENFKKAILLIRETTDEIQKTVEDEHGAIEYKRKKINPECRNAVIAKDICDIIIFQSKERFSYRGHLEAASLLSPENFLKYSKKFPKVLLNSVVGFYTMLSKEKLKIELEVIYMRGDFRNIVGALNLLSFMTNNNLDETYSEAIKLLKIVITTPMSTAEPERCFSTLKRIKTFLRNTMNEERLNALAMMSINKNFVHSIDNFDEKVVEHFVMVKNRTIDFTYKK